MIEAIASVEVSQVTKLVARKPALWDFTFNLGLGISSVFGCLIDIFKYVLNLISSLFTIKYGLASLVVFLIIKLVSRKISGMQEWKAIDMYRTELKNSGYTFRLPYKVSQIGTADFPGTNLKAYKNCCTAVKAATTPFTVIFLCVKAILLLSKNIIGKSIYVYFHARKWFKIIARIFKKVSKFIMHLFVGCVKVIQYIVLSLLGITYFTLSHSLQLIVYFRRFAALAFLVYFIYKYVRVYDLMQVHQYVNTQFTDMYAALRVMCVHCVGAMTFRIRCLTQLIIAKCHFIKVHDIIDILVKKLWHLLKHE